MKVLQANLRVVLIIVAAIAVGGWLIMMSQAADDAASPSNLGSVELNEQENRGNLPRLGQATPEASEAPVPRWASIPMPPASKEGTQLAPKGPVVVPSAGLVVIGTEITIHGQDFVPQSGVTLDLERAGGNAMLIAEDIPVNRDGTFAFPFQPGADLLPGEFTIVARSAGKEARASLRLEGGTPVVVIDPSAEKPGQDLEFSGGGFALGETVELHLDTLSSTPFLSVQADNHGAIGGEFVVPMAAEGEHTVVALGAKSRVLARGQFTVIGFYPWVNLSSYASQPEISLDFEGHNFAAEEEVWVFTDRIGGGLAGRVTTDKAGDFAFLNAYFVAPQLKGDHKFFFVGRSSQKVVEAAFTALPYNPSLKLSSYAGKVGSKVSLSGEGYARGETLRAYWGPPEDGVLLSESRAGPDGSFRGWGDLTVPYDADIMKGGANITVVGEYSQAPVGMWYTLVALTPSAELNKYAGPPGETLQFSGTGFAPTEKIIITLANSNDVLVVAQGNEDGSFENAGSFTVPKEQSEDLEFVFTGTLSDAQARTSYHIKLPGEDDLPPPVEGPSI